VNNPIKLFSPLTYFAIKLKDSKLGHYYQLIFSIYYKRKTEKFFVSEEKTFFWISYWFNFHLNEQLTVNGKMYFYGQM